MKKPFFVICLAMLIGMSYAQEENTFTDEELTKYATVMAWAESEKARMTEVYNEWINNNETLEATLFVKIRSTKGDSLKLQELEVSDEQVAAFENIQANYDSMIASFTDVYKGKIKGDIGAGLYNSLRKDLKKNSELKARYKTIFEELKSEAIKEDETEE